MLKVEDYTDEVIDGNVYKVVTVDLATQRSYRLPQKVDEKHNGLYKVIGIRKVQPKTNGVGIAIGEKPIDEANQGFGVASMGLAVFDAVTTLYIRVAEDTTIEVEG